MTLKDSVALWDVSWWWNGYRVVTPQLWLCTGMFVMLNAQVLRSSSGYIRLSPGWGGCNCLLEYQRSIKQFLEGHHTLVTCGSAFLYGCVSLGNIT